MIARTRRNPRWTTAQGITGSRMAINRCSRTPSSIPAPLEDSRNVPCLRIGDALCLVAFGLGS